ncbi:MAG: SDR family oxidoreductase [Bdellovibrionota bacterium]
MKVFVTGATGFVGSATVLELIKGGHKVLGLARSEANAKTLKDMGAEVHRGDLENLPSLVEGANACDGVIHTGFIHDFSRFKEMCEVDRRAINAMGQAYKGSKRPLIVTSGVAHVSIGNVAKESDVMPLSSERYPRASEEAAGELTKAGVNVMGVRLSPSVHGEGDHGFVPMLIDIARKKGSSAYIEDGANRWPAVHRFDSARLYRLVLEKGESGARYHGVAEEGIAFREIAKAIGALLGLPVVSKSRDEAQEHFGWFVGFAGIDCPASNVWTRETLSWRPSEIGLLEDLAKGHYSGLGFA